jgi:glucokinase
MQRKQSRPAEDAAPVTVLAGDIGGTNARLAQVEIGVGGRLRILRDAVYDSDEYHDLSLIIVHFLEDLADPPVRACLAVAGPVVAGHVKATNLPWELDEHALAEGTGIQSVRLINDFAAIGHGIEWLQADDVVTIKSGEAEPDGAIAVIGPGTGLGQGLVIKHEGRRVVLPSEGGHSSFAPTDDLDWELLRHLRRRYGHASWERVLSGPGIVNVYRFLTSRPGATERLDVRAAMEQEDPAAVITRYALEGADPICVEAIDRVVRALAAQAGNFALSACATGGVYIAGGIAPRILSKLRHPTFGKTFSSKGRLVAYLDRIPVHVIVDRYVGLRGAAVLAARTEPGSTLG